jgi:hypothetical protein
MAPRRRDAAARPGGQQASGGAQAPNATAAAIAAAAQAAAGGDQHQQRPFEIPSWFGGSTVTRLLLINIGAVLVLFSGWPDSPTGAQFIVQTQSAISRLGRSSPQRVPSTERAPACGFVGWSNYTLVSKRVVLPDGSVVPAAGGADGGADGEQFLSVVGEHARCLLAECVLHVEPWRASVVHWAPFLCCWALTRM